MFNERLIDTLKATNFWLKKVAEATEEGGGVPPAVEREIEEIRLVVAGVEEELTTQEVSSLLNL